MYFRLITHYPEQGKGAELRTLIEDHVKAENAGGASRNAFFVSMLQPTTAMVHGIQHEDFAAWERHITNRDADFEAYAAQTQTLITGIPVQEIHKVVATETSGKPVNYVWRTIHTPFPGEGPRMLGLLEQRVNSSIQRGSSSATLLSRVFDASFSLDTTFDDLAGMEAYITEAQQIGQLDAWGAALRIVSALPARQVLSRVVVPFPAK